MEYRPASVRQRATGMATKNPIWGFSSHLFSRYPEVYTSAFSRYPEVYTSVWLAGGERQGTILVSLWG